MIHIASLALALLPRLQDPSAPDPSLVVREIAARAESTEIDRLWPLVQELKKQLEAEASGPEVAAAIREELPAAAPKAQLVLVRGLLQDDRDAYSDEAATVLLKIVETNGVEAASAAALLGSREMTPKKPAEVSERLAALLDGGELDPPARIAAAQALWKLGKGNHRSHARRSLVEFFQSKDPELRAQGALALAAIEDVDTDVRRVLAQLQSEPTERGRLAKAYLEAEERAELWRKRVSEAERRAAEKSGARGKLDSASPEILRDVMELIASRHIQGDQWTKEELVAAAARGMLSELDPHSTFMTPSDFARMYQELAQEYAGIGAQVRSVGPARIFTIIRPFFSGPAYRAGLRAGDVVRAIITTEKGERGEWSTDNQAEDEIIKRLKGQPGTDVVLKVMRRGWREPQEFTITRERIQIPLLESELLPGGVGYFDVQQFGREATDQLVREIQAMRAKGLRAIVLDLRNNPGGFLEAARDMTSVFVPKGTKVCYTETSDGRRQDVVTSEAPAVPDLPVVVMVNQYSASASEITAGALQDAGRATVVGEHTYGKGSVQNLFRLPSLPDEVFTDRDGNGLYDSWETFTDANGNGKYDAGPRVKLTVERWFLPGGRNVNTEYDHTQRKLNQGGISPDVTVKALELPIGNEAELNRVYDHEALTSYARDRVPQDLELFTQLAIRDDKDWQRYPAFEDLYQKLETKLDRNEVRRWLRLRIRDKVAEERGKLFPGFSFQGDVQEDPQLREAMSVLLKKLGSSFEDAPEFKTLLANEKALGISMGPKSGREQDPVASDEDDPAGGR